MATVAEAFNAAAAFYHAGRTGEARTICQRILAALPDQADALHLLGVIAHYAGDAADAESLIERAIASRSDDASFRASLALVHKAAGRVDEAIDCYRQALRIQPDLAPALNNLGNALWERRQHDEALAVCQRAVAADPNCAPAHHNLGNVLKSLARHEQAIEHYRHALRLDPSNAKPRNGLANALAALNQLDEAAKNYRQVLRLEPNHVDALNGLACVLIQQEQFDEALHCLQRALRLDPDAANAQINLAAVLRDQGRIEESVARLRYVVQTHPRSHEAHSNLLFTLNYAPAASPAEVFEEHRRWGQAHADHLSPAIAPAGDLDPDRPLRVGYLSPDFRWHACAWFMLPILRHHNPVQVRAYCYGQVLNPDAVTEEFRTLATCYRSTVGLSDEELARRIAADRVDILVDLAGHTADNRLLTLARKPAPIQLTYLGYPNTTGLLAVDYRLTDEIADPLGAPTPHTEQLLRLPRGLSCYAPPPGTPEVNDLPAARTGHITFGSLSNSAKINASVVELWSRVLHAAPHSRLLLVRGGFEGLARERLLSLFVEHGIAAERVDIRTRPPAGERRAHSYHSIDVALDTFPYNGHTTTCEALWMGVPMVALRGAALVSRMSASVLHQAGLLELVGDGPDDFVRIAADLAGDVPRLAHLRGTLRQRVAASDLCDAPRFTRELEDTYRRLWRAYCRAPTCESRA